MGADRLPLLEVGLVVAMSSESLRWRDYFLREADGFTEFWKHFLSEKKRDVLFVLGHGFDARMCEGVPVTR